MNGKKRDTRRWANGRPPARAGLYLVQLITGDYAVAEVLYDCYVEEPGKYWAFVLDGCSCELGSVDDPNVASVVRHYGPVRRPPPVRRG